MTCFSVDVKLEFTADGKNTESEIGKCISELSLMQSWDFTKYTDSDCCF